MRQEICRDCGRVHYRTNKCPAALRKQASEWFNRGDHRTASVYAMEAIDVEVAAILADNSPLSEEDRELVKQFDAAIDKAKAALAKRPVGRPKTITDMKAYKAKWAREYRARKASKSNPNTPERNDE